MNEERGSMLARSSVMIRSISDILKKKYRAFTCDLLRKDFRSFKRKRYVTSIHSCPYCCRVFTLWYSSAAEFVSALLV